MTHLQTKNLTKHFGGVHAVNDVTISVESGERYAVIGPNGAGKSTFFNLIAGELSVTSGSVTLDGQDITDLTVNECANLGIGRTFQRNNLFLGMTVLENVRLAVQHQQGVSKRWFHPIARFDNLQESAESVLSQVGLTAEKESIVSELGYGQQRALEIALALAVQPKILLLDEPTAGIMVR